MKRQQRIRWTMRWLIELSGEHPTLPRAEVIACFEAMRARPVGVEEDGTFLTLIADARPEFIAERLSMSHFVNEEIVSGTLEEIIRSAEKIDLAGARFMVRAPAKGGGSMRHSIETKVGSALAETGKVDLKAPEVTFRVHEGRTWHLCRMLCKVNRPEFERRSTAKRPFKKPVSLHPRLARTLVNLTRVTWGQKLLDPFCGTGGILLEASFVGAEVIGSDIDAEMVVGSKRTLNHFQKNARIIRADISELPNLVGKVDAIATDPPYGRSSSTKKEPIESLYLRSFEAFGTLLKPGGHLAICLPESKYTTLAGKTLKLIEIHSVRVHGSLTRHFMVFARQP